LAKYEAIHFVEGKIIEIEDVGEWQADDCAARG
jgi:hypothetical protein